MTMRGQGQSGRAEIDAILFAKAEWHGQQAQKPIKEKVRILLELQRQERCQERCQRKVPGTPYRLKYSLPVIRDPRLRQRAVERLELVEEVRVLGPSQGRAGEGFGHPVGGSTERLGQIDDP